MAPTLFPVCILLSFLFIYSFLMSVWVLSPLSLSQPSPFLVLTVQLILYQQCSAVNHSSHTGYDLNCSSSCLWTASLLSQLHTMTKTLNWEKYFPIPVPKGVSFSGTVQLFLVVVFIKLTARIYLQRLKHCGSVSFC